MQRLSTVEPNKFCRLSGAYSPISANAFCCIVLKML